MPHDHAHHSHHHHHHHHHGGADTRTLAFAAALTGAFFVAEVVGGIVSGSLALLADAGHMLTDMAALLLALFGAWMARRPADSARTYGYGRVSVLAAFVNGLALFVIAIWISIEAVQRLFAPGEVLGGIMIWVALAGFLVNLLVFRLLTRGESDSLNIRAAALHVLGDLLGSVAALLAAAVIIWTGWTPIDPLLSVLVAVLILRSALAVMRESGQILLEGTPPGLDRQEVLAAVAAVPGVAEAAHLHLWSLTESRPMATVELRPEPGTSAEVVSAAVRAELKARFDLGHVTVGLTGDTVECSAR